MARYFMSGSRLEQLEKTMMSPPRYSFSAEQTPLPKARITVAAERSAKKGAKVLETKCAENQKKGAEK